MNAVCNLYFSHKSIRWRSLSLASLSNGVVVATCLFRQVGNLRCDYHVPLRSFCRCWCVSYPSSVLSPIRLGPRLACSPPSSQKCCLFVLCPLVPSWPPHPPRSDFPLRGLSPGLLLFPSLIFTPSFLLILSVPCVRHPSVERSSADASAFHLTRSFRSFSSVFQLASPTHSSVSSSKSLYYSHREAWFQISR